MVAENWYTDFFQKLDSKKDAIKPSEFRFYNITHLPLIAKKTFEFSEKCEICKSNIQVLDAILDSLPEILDEKSGNKKQFEQKKTKIEEHLKKIHQMRFPGYYASLLTFIGVAISLGSYFIFLKFNNLSFLKTPFLITTAVGIITGWIAGVALDKKVFKKKLQL